MQTICKKAYNNKEIKTVFSHKNCHWLFEGMITTKFIYKWLCAMHNTTCYPISMYL